MNKRQQKILKRYIGKIVPLLLLSDWEIYILRTPVPDDSRNIAENGMNYGKYRASLQFRSDFWNCTPSQQTRTIVHELIHCHFHNMSSIFRNKIFCPAVMNATMEDVSVGIWENQEEYIIDMLSRIIENQIPVFNDGRKA